VSTWLRKVIRGEPGFESALVDRYARRLLAVARVELPNSIRSRVDPEDIIQSVFRSFFARLQGGQFRFDGSLDLWRLLAAMTFNKSRNAATFHLRDRRDARRDRPLEADQLLDSAAREPTPADLVALNDCLHSLLAGLPERHRTIVLARLAGETIDAIAQSVQRCRRTVLRVLASVEDRALNGLEPPA
jgi:RNA polymerase sigma factor (sigma-70 family)